MNSTKDLHQKNAQVHFTNTGEVSSSMFLPERDGLFPILTKAKVKREKERENRTQFLGQGKAKIVSENKSANIYRNLM